MQVNELRKGRPVQLSNCDETPLIRLVGPDGDLFAIGRIDGSGLLRTSKMFVME